MSNLDRSVGLAFFFFFSAVFVTGTAHSPPIGAAVFLIDPGTGSYSTERGVVQARMVLEALALRIVGLIIRSGLVMVLL